MFALCVRRKNTAFEIQILPSVKFSIPHTNKLAECRELWQGLLTVCISLCAIRKCPHISLLRWFVKSVLLTFGFELLSWCRHNLWHNAWNRFHQQLLGKTDMNSIQSWWNKTARFRFSIKYLKLKVVLQIVCLVPALLAPKLIFYI